MASRKKGHLNRVLVGINQVGKETEKADPGPRPILCNGWEIEGLKVPNNLPLIPGAKFHNLKPLSGEAESEDNRGECVCLRSLHVYSLFQTLEEPSEMFHSQIRTT